MSGQRLQTGRMVWVHSSALFFPSPTFHQPLHHILRWGRFQKELGLTMPHFLAMHIDAHICTYSLLYVRIYSIGAIWHFHMASPITNTINSAKITHHNTNIHQNQNDHNFNHHYQNHYCQSLNGLIMLDNWLTFLPLTAHYQS